MISETEWTTEPREALDGGGKRSVQFSASSEVWLWSRFLTMVVRNNYSIDEAVTAGKRIEFFKRKLPFKMGVRGVYILQVSWKNIENA